MLVMTIMVVLLVQISVNHSVLKGWRLHPLDDLATVIEVLEQFKRGEIEGYSSFVFPEALLVPFECYITAKLSGPFQDGLPLCPSGGDTCVWSLTDVCINLSD